MKKLPAIIVVVTLCAWVRCTNPTVAGGDVTDTGNARVAARIVTPGGTGVFGATVRLRRSDYLSPVPGPAKRRGLIGADATTDSSGRFEIVGIEPGEYRLEISHAASRQAVLLDCVIGRGDTADLGTDTLRPFAVVSGTVDRAVQPTAVRYIQIAGLERLALARSDGRYRFANLPAGMLQLRIVSPDTQAVAPVTIDSVTAVSGDTTVVAPAGWQLSKRLYLNTTASGAGISDNVAGFPLLVRLASDTMHNPGSIRFDFGGAGDSGEDLRFTKPDGTLLPYEIEHWDAAAQTAAVWVRIDTVRGNDSTQYLIMHWANPAAASASNSEAVFDTTDGFEGVWHLAEQAPGVGNPDIFKDATAHNFHGTDNISATGREGIIGNGHEFAGEQAGDWIDLGHNRDFLTGAAGATLEAWVKLDSANTFYYFLSHSVGAPVDGDSSRALLYTNIHGIPGIGGRSVDSAKVTSQGGGDTLPAGSWHYLAGVIDYAGDSLVLYIDGVRVGRRIVDFPTTRTPSTPSQFGAIGASDKGDRHYVDGFMDEVRTQKTVRSASWVRLCYENQRLGQRVVDGR